MLILWNFFLINIFQSQPVTSDIKNNSVLKSQFKQYVYTHSEIGVREETHFLYIKNFAIKYQGMV